MNGDAAVDSNNHNMGIGAIIQNSKGEVMVAWSKKFSCLFSPIVIEAKTLGLSLSWARDVDLPLCLVESNTFSLVNHSNYKNFLRSVYGDLLIKVDNLCYHVMFRSIQ